MDSIQIAEHDQFLLFAQDHHSYGPLSTLLARYGPLIEADLMLDPGELLRGHAVPRLIFIDFDPGDVSGVDDPRLAAARRLCAYMAERLPQVPRVALTRYDAGVLTVEALRAGASDCIDLGREGDARHTLGRLMEIPVATVASGGPRGCSILILGARQGMGVTTLATHVADVAQMRLRGPVEPAARRRVKEPLSSETRVCLLDLGMPARDGLSYLGLSDDFHFMDAVRSLRRLDRTLLDSALSHDDQGLGILSFPPNLEELRQVSHGDALTLFNRLQDFFELTVVDTGGLGDLEFVTSLAKAAEHIWIVTDQSLGGLLSLAEELESLKARQIDLQPLRLVVNRYDSRVGLSAEQIAEKFEIPLLGTLPDSRGFLWQQQPDGRERETQITSRHPYMRAVRHLLDQAMAEDECKKRAPVIREFWNALLPGRRSNQRLGGHS
ncbi:hypothetical protein CDEF62S_00959 [Castellaniella defragrans]